MKKVVCIVAASLALSGCAYLRAVSFGDGDVKSAIEAPQTTALFLVGPTKKEELKHIKYDGFSAALDGCTEGGIGTDSIPAILLGFAAEQVIGFVTGELSARLDELQAKGQRTYTANAILEPGAFENTTCLVVVRGDKDPGATANTFPKSIGLVAVLKLERVGASPQNAASVQVKYLRMNNAVAMTGVGEPVDVAFAMVGKAARIKDNVRRIDAFAQTTLNFPGVPLGKAPKGAPAPSGLIALQPSDASAIEIVVGITESGTGLPDTEKAKAELKALAAALGPELVARAKALAGD